MAVRKALIVIACLTAARASARYHGGNDGMREVPLSELEDKPLLFTENLSDSGTCRLVLPRFTPNLTEFPDRLCLTNDVIKSIIRNGSLSEEGSLRLKDLVGNFSMRHTGMLSDDPDFTEGSENVQNRESDSNVVRNVNSETDVPEEDVDGSLTEDQLVIDYIKNVDRTIATEDKQASEPDRQYLLKLFRIMASQK